jgi:hypothetical protein
MADISIVQKWGWPLAIGHPLFWTIKRSPIADKTWPMISTMVDYFWATIFLKMAVDGADSRYFIGHRPSI